MVWWIVLKFLIVLITKLQQNKFYDFWSLLIKVFVIKIAFLECFLLAYFCSEESCADHQWDCLRFSTNNTNSKNTADRLPFTCSYHFTDHICRIRVESVRTDWSPSVVEEYFYSPCHIWSAINKTNWCDRSCNLNLYSYNQMTNLSD